MKRWSIAVLFLTAFIMTPTLSFALVDIAIHGGYTFRGDIEIVDKSYDGVNGQNFGIMGHLNLNADLFMLGMGVSYQKGEYKYDVNGDEPEFKLKSSWGPDFILMLKLRAFRIYGRVGFSLEDSLEYDYGTDQKDKERYFNSWWQAAGIGLQIIPLLNLFGEFQRCTTNMNRDHQLERYTLNAGLMFLF